MFSQQVVTKFFMADGDAAPVLAGHTDYWSTAESYYGKGCFRQVALFSTRPDELCDEEIAATDKADPPTVEAEGQQAPEVGESEPIAAAPPSPEPGPPVVESVVTDRSREAEMPVAPAELDEPRVVVSDPVQPILEMPPAPKPDQKLAPGEIDVLPLPVREETVEDSTQFGMFADQPVTSPRGTPQAESGTEYQEGFAQQGPYGVPSGHSMRYVDPKDLVRQRAIERAENRRMRIEARKWLGYDPLRPAVNPLPYFTTDAMRPAFIVVPLVVRDER